MGVKSVQTHQWVALSRRVCTDLPQTTLYKSSRLLRIRASAKESSATGASRAIFLVHGLGEIDSRYVGNRGKPGKHIGKLAHPFFMASTPQGRGQFADFLHEPHESPLDSPSNVLFMIHAANQPLKIGQRHFAGRCCVTK